MSIASQARNSQPPMLMPVTASARGAWLRNRRPSVAAGSNDPEPCNMARSSIRASQARVRPPWLGQARLSTGPRLRVAFAARLRPAYGAAPARAGRSTTMASWNIKGQYMETCNCTLLCPCIWSNLAARPTEGVCEAAVTLRIDQGQKDGVKLDGLSFIVMLHSPGPMGEGNMTVGLIVDDKADEAQVVAIRDIATGAAGGPMAALAPLVGKVAGLEKRAIKFTQDGMRFDVSAGELVDQACVGLDSLVKPGEPIA